MMKKKQNFWSFFSLETIFWAHKKQFRQSFQNFFWKVRIRQNRSSKFKKDFCKASHGHVICSSQIVAKNFSPMSYHFFAQSPKNTNFMSALWHSFSQKVILCSSITNLATLFNCFRQKSKKCQFKIHNWLKRLWNFQKLVFFNEMFLWSVKCSSDNHPMGLSRKI